MKKLTPFVLATCFMLSAIPTQIKAATDTEAAKTAMISSEKVSGTDQLNEIKSIDFTSLSTSENKEGLKEASPLANDQGRKNGIFNRRNRDVDVTIQSNQSNRHRHSGAYIGGGGVLVLIIILILIL